LVPLKVDLQLGSYFGVEEHRRGALRVVANLSARARCERPWSKISSAASDA
jgi:hypothetical protein